MAIAAAWAALAILGMALLSFITCVQILMHTGGLYKHRKKVCTESWLVGKGGVGVGGDVLPHLHTVLRLAFPSDALPLQAMTRLGPGLERAARLPQRPPWRLQTHRADLVLPWPKSSPRVHVLHGGGLQQPHLIEARINNTRREGDHYLIVAYTRRSPGWRRKEKHEEVCFAITDLSLLLA